MSAPARSAASLPTQAHASLLVAHLGIEEAANQCKIGTTTLQSVADGVEVVGRTTLATRQSIARAFAREFPGGGRRDTS